MQGLHYTLREETAVFPSSPAITRCWSHLGHKHPKQLAEPLVQVETTALGQLNGLCQTDALLLLPLCGEGV